MTPLEQAAELVHFINSGRPLEETAAAGPTVLKEHLGDDRLVYFSERLYCWGEASHFAEWFGHYVAWLSIPADDVAVLLVLLPAYVEAMLLARITWPHLFEEPEEVVAPRTAGEARDAGLTVQRKQTKLRTPTLPGCQGRIFTGVECPNLRIRGATFCPACELAFDALPTPEME
jgi:hypothetical protein